MANVKMIGDAHRIVNDCKAAGLSLNQAAYVLATAWHESAHTMKAVRETLAKTDAQAKARLTKAWKAGKLPGVKRDYWSGGYYGRGHVQITHRENYEKASRIVGSDLVKHPDRMLEPAISIAVMIDGMVKGWFRKGHKLATYINSKGADFRGARNIINGDVKKNGGLIAGYAKEYAAKLASAGYSVPASTPKPAPAPIEPPKPQPAPTPSPAPYPVTRDLIRRVQRTLFEKGYTEVGSQDRVTGEFDGVKGKFTDTAILAAKSENGFEPLNADITEEFVAALPTWPKRKLAEKRTEITTGEVAAQKPEARASWWGRLAGFVLAVPSFLLSVGVGALEYLGVAKGYIDQLKEYGTDVPPEIWFGLALVISIGFWAINHYGLLKSTQAVANGERR